MMQAETLPGSAPALTLSATAAACVMSLQKETRQIFRLSPAACVFAKSDLQSTHPRLCGCGL